MDFGLAFSATVVAALFTFFTSIRYLLRLSKSSSHGKKKLAPEPAGAWPLIGHLPMLAGPKQLHIVLTEMGEKYGPIISMRLGTRRALVVSSWELVKECFTTNDTNFSNRPHTLGVEHLGQAHFGFYNYGPSWRVMRKVATIELLSNHRLRLFAHIREQEVKSAIREIYSTWGERSRKQERVVVEMSKWFSDFTLNLMGRIVLGKEQEDEQQHQEWHKLLRELFEFLGTFCVSDALPFLRWLDIGGYDKAMKKTAKGLDRLLHAKLEKHKQRRDSRETKSDYNFMDVLLSTLDEQIEKAIGLDADTINKATCLALIQGGTDTTTATLTWTISLLLNNRHALKKIQEELDEHVGRERQLEESDIRNLVYLQAAVKETLRLYPPSLVLPSRETIADCTVGGYHVQAETILFLNLWQIHRDPTAWPEPEKFRPERFLTDQKDIDVRGQNFELIPFGSGKRVCPGISMALQVACLTLATFLHGFAVETPTDEPVDMRAGFGLTNPKNTPLEVLITPRLSAELY